MRNRTGWLACLVMIGVLGAPTGVYGQNQLYEVPPPPGQGHVPWPLYNPRPEEGGFYTAVEFLFMKQNNPMGNQVVAVRGFLDVNGSVSNELGLGGVPGTFFGSGAPALNVDQVSGPTTFTPGFNWVMGWRFRDGLAVEISWLHLVEARYSATASLATFDLDDPFGANTFLFSPVFNFPTDYAGPDVQLQVGAANATFGIWNAASLMTIDFIQRYDRFQLAARYPLQDSECWRTYGLFGPRISWLWERFKWRTVDLDVNGVATPNDVAFYSNWISQRLYGVHIGVGNEWMLGATPVGAFSLSLDVEGALSVDFAKARARYEIGDGHTAATRARNFFNIVPEVDAGINLWWYPYHGIQLRAGYSVMAFFNTLASPEPIDFNYGAINPNWEQGFTRIIHGFNAGISFNF